MSSPYRVKVRSLFTLDPTDGLWDKLINLSVPNWGASKVFPKLRYLRREAGYTKAKIRIVYHDGEPIAWGMVIHKTDEPFPSLWLYTDPSYRRQDIQKKLILPYWRNRIKTMVKVQLKHPYQRETFKYYSTDLKKKV